MIRVIADNIYSPLGQTTAENYAAVKAGSSMLRCYAYSSEDSDLQDSPTHYPAPHAVMSDLPEPFTASLFDWHKEKCLAGYTRFESIVIQSVKRALAQTAVDTHSDRLLFILSTTKGNVELLDSRSEIFPEERVLLGVAARHIADHFGFCRQPIVVSNACISGLSAQVTAIRLLESGACDTAVVCGADVQSRFVISGFSSFKALSPVACRPFDIERLGLNLGEAAATIVFSNDAQNDGEPCWQPVGGAICNDAHHISAPSTKGEGSYRAIRAAMGSAPADSLAFVNAHGTSTMYNDEMESSAIDRAGLIGVPVNSLKGYYGHTMGAAGVLETILSMAAADDGCILGTRGYEELGVSHRVKVSGSHEPTAKHSFLKLLSGFGGCNAAMLFSKRDGHSQQPTANSPQPTAHSQRPTALITADKVVVNGEPLTTTSRGAALLTEVYRSHVNDYPKFFKMDELSKLGFLASELLLKAVGDRHADSEDRAVILFGRSGSVASDRRYQATIERTDDYYPSPSIFVYTLPNIVTGEIAIRNQYHGETAFYALDEYNAQTIRQVVRASMLNPMTRSVVCGWVDCESADCFDAYMTLYIKE